ncbi:MAG: hypothetical protein IT428_33410 [Planctomycetaceae bacterium]|nr:hypothetical protein [Planctomycetaceae bacterium]
MSAIVLPGLSSLRQLNFHGDSNVFARRMHERGDVITELKELQGIGFDTDKRKITGFS